MQFQIDEIVLDGVSLTESQSLELQMALQAEFASTRLTTGAIYDASAIQLQLNSISLPSNATPRILASSIANSIRASLHSYESIPTGRNEKPK